MTEFRFPCGRIWAVHVEEQRQSTLKSTGSQCESAQTVHAKSTDSPRGRAQAAHVEE